MSANRRRGWKLGRRRGHPRPKAGLVAGRSGRDHRAAESLRETLDALKRVETFYLEVVTSPHMSADPFYSIATTRGLFNLNMSDLRLLAIAARKGLIK